MGGLAVYLQNDFGQVYGRYAQLIGIKSDLPARFVVFADQHGEPHGDIFLVGIHERALLGARRLLEKDIEIPVINPQQVQNGLPLGNRRLNPCNKLISEL